MRLISSLLLLTLIACADSFKATEAAQQYVLDIYPECKARKILCDTVDSDGNGKVRCTLSLEKKESTSGATCAVEFVECPSSWGPQFSSVCVPLKGVTR